MRSTSGGLEKISMTILLTCGQTKLQCNSKHTGGSAAGKRARIRSPAINHPIKLHVWGGISYCGTTKLCIFDGIMNAELYIQILKECLVIFLNQVYLNGHCFMQDMIQSTHLAEHRHFSLSKTSIGGGLPQKTQMQTQLKTCGTS